MTYGPPPLPPPGPLPAGPPSPPPRPRPQARGSLALPLIGLVVVLACFLVVPWAHAGDNYVTVPDIWDKSGNLPGYLAGVWFVVFLLAAPISLAGTLDSLAFRVIAAVLFGCGALLLLVIGVIFLVGAVFMSGPDEGRGKAYAIIVSYLLIGLVGVGLAVCYGLLHGLALRIVSGLLLLAAAVGHFAAVDDMTNGHADAGAYLACLGYLLCAAGAFIGPAYLQPAPRPMYLMGGPPVPYR